MKTISKKIKSIYLLAIMAILSICVAVFPAFKTQSVKAEDTPTGLSVTGASLELGKRYAHKDFVLMFQAEITEEWYNKLTTENSSAEIKFGMAIGPTSKIGSITTFEALDDIADDIAGGPKGNAYLYELDQAIDFTDETAFTYEAGTLFSAFVDGYETLTVTEWQQMYAVELTAIPFYSVGGEVVLVDNKFATSAKQAAIDLLYAETALPISEATLSVESAAYITGLTFKEVYTESARQIYFDQKENLFMVNFHAGNFALVDSLRFWTPYQYGQSSGGFLSGEKFNTHLAGQQFKSSKTMNWTTRGKHLLDEADVASVSAYLKSTKPGTYACYYTNPNTKAIEWFDYDIASAIFTNISAPASGQGNLGVNLGTAIHPTIQYTESGSASTYQGSYFAIRFASDNYYMPYSRTSSSYVYEQENYGGYYVLGNDLVVPTPVDGANADHSKIASNVSVIGTHGAPTNQTTVRALSIGALKYNTAYCPNRHIDEVDADLVPGFTGVFDGKGHTIDASFTRGGLFGVIKGGTVKNLNVKADLYNFDMAAGGTDPYYANDSYAEKNAVLAEVIADGSTIENVSITLKESAPVTFENFAVDQYGTSKGVTEMNNVPGLIAAQGIYGENTTLKNVIVTIDSLKDAGVSIQNYRAALNVSEDCTLDNVFVIGSSYSNMSITSEKVDGVTEYVLTLSAPAGIVPGTYAYADKPALANYFAMAKDMFKFMRNVDVAVENITVVFVDEPAKKFASEFDFQAWLKSDAAGADAKKAFTDSKVWVEDTDGNLVWANSCEKDVDYFVFEGSLNDPIKPTTADEGYNPFGWTEYAPTIVKADGTLLGATA